MRLINLLCQNKLFDQLNYVVGFMLLLLVYQYGGGFRALFSFLSTWESVPHTLVFIAILFIIIFFDFRFLLLEKNGFVRNCLYLFIIIAWVSSLVYSFSSGASVSLPISSIWIVILLFGIMSVGIGTYFKKVPISLLIFLVVGFLIYASYLIITTVSFDALFTPGRPLWNIRNSSIRLMNGEWIYSFGDGLTPAYPPLGLLPYMPFGFLGWDLRWANLLAAILIVIALSYAAIKENNQSIGIIVVLVFSPPFIYYVLTTQVVFYWLILVLFILALAKEKLYFQRLLILIAAFMRPLAWPIFLLWIIFQNVIKKKRDLVRYFLRTMLCFRPTMLEALIVLFVFAVFIVDPRSFFWNIFILPRSDGLRAINSGIPQPAGQISLLPLLPIWMNPTLVLIFQFVLVFILIYLSVRSGYLEREPVKVALLAYAIFLTFNFVAYDYYWMDVILMAIASVVTQKTRG